MRRQNLFVLLAIGIVASTPLVAQPAPQKMEELVYDRPFFPGTTYDESIPTVEEILGFRPGDRAAFPHEVERAIRTWAEVSPRAEVVEYARSYEGRPLHYVIVSSEANMARIDEIKGQVGRLGDPRTAESVDLAGQPAVAWMAYSIHGDETSGTDSALAVLYHLIAGMSEDVTKIRDEVIVLVDPAQNPDGRHRFLQQVAEHRAVTPNVDDQSLLHSGYWPWGRMNHYLFDLNRDWLLGVNPESRGRIAAAGEWHPQLMVDAHEMGAQDTYLFSPASDPRNPHMPGPADKWNDRFARDQAAAFDRNGWVYYTGEWNEGWYPGYTDIWGAMRGAVGILYEQASFTEDGVRRPGGDVHSYREAVHKQAVSSIANLATLAENRVEILRDYVADRKTAMGAEGPYGRRAFALPPTENASRWRRFVDLMELQGVEMYRLSSDLRVSGVKDQFGRQRSVTLPAGTVVVPNGQPEARWIATMLQFDEPMTDEYLARERSSILRGEGSTIYDVTAWNLTMMHGLEAYELPSWAPSGAARFVPSETGPPVLEPAAPEAVAWILDGADDASVAAAARLLEQGVEVRVAKRAGELSGRSFERGSVVVQPADNRRFEGDVAAIVTEIARELGLGVHSVATGLGDGELPDLGGGLFVRLERPRIALMARGGLSAYDYGTVWHLLDQQLAIRHSQIDEHNLDYSDLRRYNVVVLPDRWYLELGDAARETLSSWVKAGGTLIAIAGSADEVAAKDSELTQARRLADVLGELDAYEADVLREWMASQDSMPAATDVWAHRVPAEGDTPWKDLGDLTRPATEVLERNDAWERLFMPQGAFVAARTDPKHWLTFGTPAELPVLVNHSSVLMAKDGVEAPVRLGIYEAGDGEPRRAGWSALPKGQDLRLRMSGLVWPEAASRLANSAYVTREASGNGQVILFTATPHFRASTHGTARLLLNALIYGPGFGASAPIVP